MISIISIYYHGNNPKIVINGFNKQCRTPLFFIPNTWIEIFPDMTVILKWCLLLPSTIMQKIRNFYDELFLRKCQKSFFHLIPWLRFFPNMKSYSNYTPYCILLLHSKMETLNSQFLRKLLKTDLLHLIPLNSWFQIFPRYEIILKSCPLLPSTIM